MAKKLAIKTKTLGDVLKYSYNHKKGRRANFDGYQLDEQLSGKRAQVYRNDEGKAIVAHRGTQGLRDWITDAGFALGIKGRRFKHAAKVQRAAEKKYGSENISTVGHSLGAALAEENGKRSKNVVTLNKPTRPQDLFKRQRENQVDIRSSLDPVSVLAPLRYHNPKRNITIKSETYDPLIEHSTGVLDRIQGGKLIINGIMFTKRNK